MKQKNINNITDGMIYRATDVMHLLGCGSHSKLSQVTKMATMHGVYPIKQKPKVYEGGQIKEIIELIKTGKLCKEIEKKKKSSRTYLIPKEIQKLSTKQIKQQEKKDHTTLHLSF